MNRLLLNTNILQITNSCMTKYDTPNKLPAHSGCNKEVRINTIIHICGMTNVQHTHTFTYIARLSVDRFDRAGSIKITSKIPRLK